MFLFRRVLVRSGITVRVQVGSLPVAMGDSRLLIIIMMMSMGGGVGLRGSMITMGQGTVVLEGVGTRGTTSLTRGGSILSGGGGVGGSCPGRVYMNRQNGTLGMRRYVAMGINFLFTSNF